MIAHTLVLLGLLGYTTVTGEDHDRPHTGLAGSSSVITRVTGEDYDRPCTGLAGFSRVYHSNR